MRFPTTVTGKASDRYLIYQSPEKAVNNRPWLEKAEYLSLLGSGVGAVASVASQQIFYTVAPLSCLLALSLVNRRRLEQLTQQTTTTAISQLDQRLSRDLETLQQEVRGLPTFVDLGDLRKSVLQSQREAIASLQKEVADRLAPFEEHSLILLHKEIDQLQDQYAYLHNSLDNIAAYLYRLPTTARVEYLESTVTHLQTETIQLQTSLQTLAANFPELQSHIDGLKQQLKALPQTFALDQLKQEVEQLYQKHLMLAHAIAPLKGGMTTFQQQLSALNRTLLEMATAQPAPQLLNELQNTINQLQAGHHTLEQRLDRFPGRLNLADVDKAIQEFANIRLDQLHEQVASIQQVNQKLERQQRELREQMNRLSQVMDFTALQRQLQYLTTRVDGVEQDTTQMRLQIETVVQQELADLNQQIKPFLSNAQTEMVFALASAPQSPQKRDHPRDRSLLQQAVAQTQNHLVMVLPWPSHDYLDDDLMQQFINLLDRQAQVEIGWGHLEQLEAGQVSRYINQRWSLNRLERSFLVQTLDRLTHLKHNYPKQFSFKILGTHGQFLVCDRTVAMIGVHHIPLNSDFPGLEVGLRTTDPQMIQDLLNRFENPILDDHDTAAYLNRGATRYELGDKPGAIADYTQALRMNPQDDVAYNNRGLVYYDLEDASAAIADFNQALKLNPGNVAAYCNRAFARAHHQDLAALSPADYTEVISDYTQAIALDPKNTYAYFYRGLTRTRWGDKLGAIADYTTVIRINPEDATAYFYRSLARIKLEDPSGAIEDLQTATSLFSAQGDAANCQKARDVLCKLLKVEAWHTEVDKVAARLIL